MKVDIVRLDHIDNIEKLRSVLEEISSIIGGTIGPNGRTAILYNGSAIPHVTKDGVTVAEFLKFDDPFKEAVNAIIKETARRTGQDVGDGTTTSILLACYLAAAVLKYEGDKKKLLHKLDVDLRTVIDYIQRIKKDLDITSEEVREILDNIVFISSNGDEDITILVMDAVDKIGVDGLIDVVLSGKSDTYITTRQGMLIEAPAMLIPRPVEIGEAQVILVAGKVLKVHEFTSTLQLAYNTKLPTIVIADEFSKEIQDIVLANNRQNKIEMYLVESDGFGPGALEILDDMATVLKCKVMSTDNTSPFSLQNIDVSDVGIVRGATISPNSTVLYPSEELDDIAKEVKDSIIAHIHAIKEDGESRPGELRHVEKRLAKFTKSATIHVGGLTEAEAIEKKDRVDDAVHALHAAIKNGVVPGGGSTLYRAADLVETDLFVKLCKLPAETLHANSGSNEVLEELYGTDNTEVVINYANNEVGNAFELGILDPADVQIKALAQAIAITKTLVNTHVLLIPTQREWHVMQGEL